MMDIRELLHELASNAQHCPIEKLLWPILKQRLVRATMSCFSLFVDRVLDLCHLSVDKVLIGSLLGEQVQENLACIVMSVLRNELYFAEVN